MLLQGIAVARTGKVLVNTQEANDSEKELTLMLIHASADLETTRYTLQANGDNNNLRPTQSALHMS